MYMICYLVKTKITVGHSPERNGAAIAQMEIELGIGKCSLYNYFLL